MLKQRDRERHEVTQAKMGGGKKETAQLPGECNVEGDLVAKR